MRKPVLPQALPGSTACVGQRIRLRFRVFRRLSGAYGLGREIKADEAGVQCPPDSIFTLFFFVFSYFSLNKEQLEVVDL